MRYGGQERKCVAEGGDSGCESDKIDVCQWHQNKYREAKRTDLNWIQRQGPRNGQEIKKTSWLYSTSIFSNSNFRHRCQTCPPPRRHSTPLSLCHLRLRRNQLLSASKYCKGSPPPPLSHPIRWAKVSIRAQVQCCYLPPVVEHGTVRHGFGEYSQLWCVVIQSGSEASLFHPHCS